MEGIQGIQSGPKPKGRGKVTWFSSLSYSICQLYFIVCSVAVSQAPGFSQCYLAFSWPALEI